MFESVNLDCCSVSKASTPLDCEVFKLSYLKFVCVCVCVRGRFEKKGLWKAVDDPGKKEEVIENSAEGKIGKRGRNEIEGAGETR